jgi:hypothetical protein
MRLHGAPMHDDLESKTGELRITEVKRLEHLPNAPRTKEPPRE